jgi:hypothetical protein
MIELIGLATLCIAHAVTSSIELLRQLKLI